MTKAIYVLRIWVTLDDWWGCVEDLLAFCEGLLHLGFLGFLWGCFMGGFLLFFFLGIDKLCLNHVCYLWFLANESYVCCIEDFGLNFC